MDEDELAVAHFFFEEGVGGFFGFALLVGGDEGFAGGFGQLHRAAFAGGELAGFEFASVEEGQGEALHPGAKFLHQIEGERFAAGAVGMEVADEGVESGGGEGGHAIVAEEGVEK